MLSLFSCGGKLDKNPWPAQLFFFSIRKNSFHTLPSFRLQCTFRVDCRNMLIYWVRINSLKWFQDNFLLFLFFIGVQFILPKMVNSFAVHDGLFTAMFCFTRISYCMSWMKSKYQKSLLTYLCHVRLLHSLQ